jgi:hypothetical protein
MTRRRANLGQRPFMVSGDSMKRIAAAVQGYEHGNRSQSPVKFRTATGDEGDGLKLCRTTAAWYYDTTATLDVYHGGEPGSESSSDETVDAVNKVADVDANTWVLVGKAANGAWYLIEIGRGECPSAERLTSDSFSLESDDAEISPGSGAQVLIHSGGCLKWVSLSQITVITNAYLGEYGLTFELDTVWAFADIGEPPSDIDIATIDCEQGEGSGSDDGSS